MKQNSNIIHVPIQASNDDSDIIDLAALFSTLWHGKWLIGFITGLAILAGAYYSYFAATPLFRSTAVVILETHQANIVNLDSVIGGLTGDTSEVNSEVEVLRSRKLMGKVVTRLKLVEDPEFNTDLQPESLRSKTNSALGLHEPVSPMSAIDSAQRRLDLTIDQLLERVTIRNIPLSLVFQVTAETRSAEKSALIADTIVDLYILNQLEVKFEATEQATTWLTTRVTELQLELEKAEGKVKEFSASTDLIGVQALQALERQLKDLRERIQNLGIKKATEIARLATLKTAGTLEEKATVADDAQLTGFLQRLSAGNESIETAGFNTRFTQIIQRAELEVSRSKSQLAALVISQSELEQRITLQSRDLITLQQLMRESEANRLLYEYFLARLKETSAQEGIQQADSRILSNAVVPTRPSAPNKPMALVMSGIIGLMLGAGLVLFREARNNTYRTIGDLEAGTGYTVLGQIPRIPFKKRKDLMDYFADKPISATAEAVRNLRTSVMLSNADTPPKVILSTSAISGEGKTTNSIALAQNMTGLGKSVLLIEGDIRRRIFSQYVGNPDNRGLVAVLSGESGIDEVLVHHEKLGADLLMGGETTASAADLFASGGFSDFINKMRDRYDIIIIDSPPVLIVPDARVIAQSADAILFTVKWNSTSRAQIAQALQMFESVNQKITGLVLSQISRKSMKRYGYGYGGKYGYKSDYYAN